MITEKANIIRQNRRSIKIIISETGEINIYAPKHISNTDIERYVGNKESWAVKKSNRAKEKIQNNRGIFEYSSVLICGKEYAIKFCDTKTIGILEEYLLIPKKYSGAKLIPSLKKWLKTLAEELLVKRLKELSVSTKLSFCDAKIGDFRAKWGSCDSNKNIKLNYKLVMLPHKLIDAVILHELVHTKEMNHSQNFYTKLIAIMPEYKKYRLQLKEYSYLLKLYK